MRKNKFGLLLLIAVMGWAFFVAAVVQAMSSSDERDEARREVERYRRGVMLCATMVVETDKIDDCLLAVDRNLGE